MNFKEGVIIPIDKPYGITSFKALAHVRYLCSQAQGGRVKIGHVAHSTHWQQESSYLQRVR